MDVREGRKTGDYRHISALPGRLNFSIAGISLALLVEACFRGAVPLAAGFLIDHALIVRDRNRLFITFAVLAAALLASLAAGVIRDQLYSRWQGQALGNIRESMYERLQHISLNFHSHSYTEGILERFSQDLGRVEKAFSMAVSGGILSLIEGAICSGLMCWLDWRVGLLGLLFWPWVLLAPRTVADRATEAVRNYKDEELRILGVVEESLTARLIIRAFSLEHMGISLFRKRNASLTRNATRAGFLSALMDRLTGAGIVALQVAVLLLSASMAFQSRITPGTLVTLQLLAMALGSTLLSGREYLPVLEDGRGAWLRIQEGLTDPAPVVDKPDAKTLLPLHHEIVFSSVSYRYDKEHAALGGVSIRVPRGAYVALVGPSGSGKSSVLRMLMRFHDPDSGMVTIDGHDLRSVTQSSLRSRVGVVLQENFIFNTSLRENIRLGRSDSSDDMLEEVARVAGVDQFAAALPDGLETLACASGISLNAEAMQRLALARALLRSPDILLLDEVASALDATQEESVNATIRHLAHGRTVVSVTHRLSTAVDASDIYVFDHGKIVEKGSHFELMAIDGFYASLWRKQAGFRFSSDGTHVDVDAKRLKQFPVLERLPEEVLAELAPCFATETFPPGRDIVCQNDPGDKFFIIARGKVEVWRTEEQAGSARPSNTRRVAVLQDGDFFGEITLITGFPRTATVRTRTVCTCISLERFQFNRLIDRFPDLRRELSEIAVQRLRESSRSSPLSLGFLETSSPV